MYTHSNPENKKSIRYLDPATNVTRCECREYAKSVNNALIIKPHLDDWVLEFGDDHDRTNLDAISTWVANQRDILVAKNRNQRDRLLKSRFRKTMNIWIRWHLENDSEKY